MISRWKAPQIHYICSMTRQWTRFLCFFLLSAFLFPAVVKEVHAVQHEETVHCKAADKHFHATEHNCSICAFVVPVTVAPSRLVYDFSISAFSGLVLSFYETKIISSPKYFVSLRAPPLC